MLIAHAHEASREQVLVISTPSLKLSRSHRVFQCARVLDKRGKFTTPYALSRRINCSFWGVHPDNATMHLVSKARPLCREQTDDWACLSCTMSYAPRLEDSNFLALYHQKIKSATALPVRTGTTKPCLTLQMSHPEGLFPSEMAKTLVCQETQGIALSSEAIILSQW